MMKKLHLIGLMCLLGLGFNELWGQTISITNWSTDPTKPRTICQCDTFDLPVNKTPGPGNHKEAIRYFLSGNFNPTTEFAFEFANPVNAFATADSLDILDISIRTAVGPPPTFASDTFSGPAEHYASVVIPCNAPLGPASLRISNSSGVKSDTIYFIVNRIPDPAVIKSVTNAVDNPYTPTVPDLGFCQGDTVVLEAEQQPGANYQWFRNGSAIAGETDTIHKAIIPGTYSLRIDLGACPRMSKDTILNVFPRATLGNLEFVPSPMAFQMDNPIIPNVSPDDSVMFCESVTATLNAPRTPPAGVTFEYQWITDTIDPNSGQPIYFPIDTVSAGKPRMDTSQSLTIDSSLISFVNGEARVYLTIYDGFCNDTSRTIFLFMDSIPATVVRNRTWDKGVLLPINVNSDICMKDDSLILSSSYTASNIKYQWQRSLNGSSWANLPSANNPTVNGTMRTLNVDTSYKPKPTPTITYYRLVTSTVTPFTNDVVCSFTSDSVRIRWLPDYRVEVAPGQPQVTFIAPDTVNFCETDSAIVRGPASPDPFVLPYKYGWLKDTVNALNQTVQIPTGPNDTLRNVTVRKSGKYYVTFDDGICIDTSRAVYVYVDTIPQTNLVSVPFAGIPPKVDPFDRCLYDSVQISVTDTVRPGWDYQWQRFVETVGWIDLVNDTNPAIVVDTSYTPLEDTTLYRVVINYTNRFG
ncbi:MAG TPA: hypothetical protein DDW81_16635, partial [Cryomorphaceae bacterium]|nr:hypothetical protein [Cryomorphaceae bacterium]